MVVTGALCHPNCLKSVNDGVDSACWQCRAGVKRFSFAVFKLAGIGVVTIVGGCTDFVGRKGLWL